MQASMNAWKQFPSPPANTNPSRELRYEDHRTRQPKINSESGSESNFKVVIRVRPPSRLPSKTWDSYNQSAFSGS